MLIMLIMLIELRRYPTVTKKSAQHTGTRAQRAPKMPSSQPQQQQQDHHNNDKKKKGTKREEKGEKKSV
jgi:hypothetical protein